MILLIDNYDSFTYNLYQTIGVLYKDITVKRNDEITIDEISQLRPEAIIISPGPGYPKDAGISVEVIKHFSGIIPILGVCLGHQGICAAFGARITYARRLMHGKQSDVEFDTRCKIFKDCPVRSPVARYHSLAADPATIPEELRVTARTTEGEIMGVEHVSMPVYGVQFHPESIMTPCGRQMLMSFLQEG